MALLSNFDLISTLAGDRRIGIVIKGDAYGHNALHVAQLFDADSRVEYFFTAGLIEAQKLRASGIVKKIMAMAYCDGDIESALYHGIEPSIATHDELIAINEAAVRLNLVAPVHIKVDTGLARRGVDWDSAGSFYAEVIKYPKIDVVSIFTHCADSSPEDPAFIYEQQRRYDYLLDQVRALGFSGMTHMASSGSLTLIDNYDMVRVGTMLYGSWKNSIQKARVVEKVPHASLIPVLTVYAPIIQKNYDCVTIAWGFNYSMAAIPGIPVLYKCGCLGKIITVIDTMSSVQKVCVHDSGDQVIVCGPYNGITPVEIASACGTIANEITTRISSSIIRSIFPLG